MSEFTYSATGLPDGLTLDPLTGRVTGTPTTPGPFNCVLMATAGGVTGSCTWSPGVDPNEPTLIGTLPGGKVGRDYWGGGNARLVIDGYAAAPLAVDAAEGGMPSWMTAAAGGSFVDFHGVPNNPGTVTFTPRVTDSSNPPRVAVGQSQTIVIADDPMLLNGTLLHAATVGVPYQSTLTLGGYYVAPMRVDISAGTMPSWMHVSASGSTVTFSGTPDATGAFTFTPRATDSNTPTQRVATAASQSVTVTKPLFNWTENLAPFRPTALTSDGNGRYVIAKRGAYVGTLAASSDAGATWVTSTAAPQTQAWDEGAYGAGVFLVVADAGVCVTSPDAATWTASSLAAKGTDFHLCYGNGLFVANAETGAPGYGDGKAIETSADGLTWTYQPPPSGFVACRGLAYGNGLFLAVGSGSTPVISSPDGVNWVATGSSASVDALTFGNGVFASISGNNIIATADDGVTWSTSALPAPPDGDAWKMLAFCNGVWIVLPGYSGVFAASTDGSTWSTYAFPSAHQWYKWAVSGNTILVGALDNTIMTGIT